MKKKMLLTIDVDYHPGSEIGVEKILDLLDRKEIKATFFIAGKFAEEYEEVIEKIYNKGHEIGCHGYSHGKDQEENFVDLELDEQRKRIKVASEILSRISGGDIRLFRAPFGKVSVNTIKVLEEFGYKCDSSVTAMRFDFGFGVGNNIRAFFAPTRPYHPSEHNIFREGNSKILEVPMSAFIVPLTLSAIRAFGVKSVCRLFDFSNRFFDPVVFYLHPWEVMKTDEIFLWEGLPKRHMKNRGENALLGLERFIDYVGKKSEFLLYRDIMEVEPRYASQ